METERIKKKYICKVTALFMLGQKDDPPKPCSNTYTDTVLFNEESKKN